MQTTGFAKAALITLACACCLLTATAGALEPPVFKAVGLPQWYDADLGAISASPPETLPDNTLAPPAAPQTPIPLGALATGAEWYISALGVVRGPMTASSARERYQRTTWPTDFRVWRPGKRRWLAAAEAEWLTSGEFPTPIPEIFVQSLPPSIPADEFKVWFVKPTNVVEWSGPYTAEDVPLKPFGIQAWGPLTSWWTAVGEKADNVSGVAVNPRKPFPVIDSEPPGHQLVATPDAARASMIAARLRGHWVMQGPLVDDLLANMIQVVFDEEGGIALRLTETTASGSIIGGGGWWSGRYRGNPITDDTALVSASFSGSLLRYGVPGVLKFTLLTDDTMRDDWSGLTLTRRDILPE